MDASNDNPSMDMVSAVCEIESVLPDSSCMPERAALIKSILNFLKKAIPEPTFAENIRNCERDRCSNKCYGIVLFLLLLQLSIVFDLKHNKHNI